MSIYNPPAIQPLGTVVTPEEGGTGLSETPAAGEVLIGTSDGTYALAKLEAGAGISILSASGEITISSTIEEGVQSVAFSVPTGLEVSGSPITTTGTFTVTYAAGYSIPTTAKQGEWDMAYGWGNHAAVGYLTSVSWEEVVGAPTIPTKVSDLTNDSGFLSSVSWTIVTDKPSIPENVSDLVNDSGFISAESDPIFSVSAAAGISSGDIVNWDTAYTWGDHSAEGYLTSADIGVSIGTVNSVELTAGAGISISGGPITDTGSISVTNSDRGSSQAIFKTIAVSGYPSIKADSNDDTLTFVAGSNIILATNTANNSLLISASGGGGGDKNIDGGSASTVYLPGQNIDGGSASG